MDTASVMDYKNYKQESPRMMGYAMFFVHALRRDVKAEVETG